MVKPAAKYQKWQAGAQEKLVEDRDHGQEARQLRVYIERAQRVWLSV